MPAFALWVGSLFSSLVGWFASYVSKRIAVVAAVLTALGVIVSTFMAAIKAAMAGLAASFPSGWVAVGLGMLPGATDDLAAVVLTAHTAAWLYQMATKTVQLRLF